MRFAMVDLEPVNSLGRAIAAEFYAREFDENSVKRDSLGEFAKKATPKNDGLPDLTGWDAPRERHGSLEGQRSLFGNVNAKPAKSELTGKLESRKASTRQKAIAANQNARVSEWFTKQAGDELIVIGRFKNDRPKRGESRDRFIAIREDGRATEHNWPEPGKSGNWRGGPPVPLLDGVEEPEEPAADKPEPAKTSLASLMAAGDRYGLLGGQQRELFAKRLKDSPGQSHFWDPDDHPREPDGTFAEKGEGDKTSQNIAQPGFSLERGAASTAATKGPPDLKHGDRVSVPGLTGYTEIWGEVQPADGLGIYNVQVMDPETRHKLWTNAAKVGKRGFELEPEPAAKAPAVGARKTVGGIGEATLRRESTQEGVSYQLWENEGGEHYLHVTDLDSGNMVTGRKYPAKLADEAKREYDKATDTKSVTTDTLSDAKSAAKSAIPDTSNAKPDTKSVTPPRDWTAAAKAAQEAQDHADYETAAKLWKDASEAHPGRHGDLDTEAGKESFRFSERARRARQIAERQPIPPADKRKAPRSVDMSPPADAAELITWGESQEAVQAHYRGMLDEANIVKGVPRPSARSTPAPDHGIPLGTWRVDDKYRGIHGHQIEQLRELDPNSLIFAEDMAMTNDEGRADDAERYKEWRKQGKRPPPISVTELENGGLRIADGHRRSRAAQLAGEPIEAWVSPAAKTDNGTPTGLTWEMVKRERGEWDKADKWHDPEKPPSELKAPGGKSDNDRMLEMIRRDEGLSDYIKRADSKLPASAAEPDLSSKIERAREIHHEIENMPLDMPANPKPGDLQKAIDAREAKRDVLRAERDAIADTAGLKASRPLRKEMHFELTNRAKRGDKLAQAELDARDAEMRRYEDPAEIAKHFGGKVPDLADVNKWMSGKGEDPHPGAKGTGGKPSDEEMEHFHFLHGAGNYHERQAGNRNVERAGDATAIEFVRTTKDGAIGKIIVHPSVKIPGTWQLSEIARDGEAWGDTNFKTKENALRAIAGESVEGEMSYGRPGEWEITNTAGGKKSTPAVGEARGSRGTGVGEPEPPAAYREYSEMMGKAGMTPRPFEQWEQDRKATLAKQAETEAAQASDPMRKRYEDYAHAMRGAKIEPRPFEDWKAGLKPLNPEPGKIAIEERPKSTQAELAVFAAKNMPAKEIAEVRKAAAMTKDEYVKHISDIWEKHPYATEKERKQQVRMMALAAATSHDFYKQVAQHLPPAITEPVKTSQPEPAKTDNAAGKPVSAEDIQAAGGPDSVGHDTLKLLAGHSKASSGSHDFVAEIRAAAGKRFEGFDAMVKELEEKAGDNPVLAELLREAKPRRDTIARILAEHDRDPSVSVSPSPSREFQREARQTEDARHARDLAARGAKFKKTAAKLREMADSMAEAADSELGRDRLTNTWKRSNQAAGAIEDAYKQQAKANTLRNIADHLEGGNAQHIAGVKNRAQVESLDLMLYRGRQKFIQQLPQDEYNREKHAPYTAEHAAAAKYPYPSINKVHVADILKAIKGKPGSAKIAEAMGPYAVGDWRTMTSESDLEALDGLIAMGEKYGEKGSARWLKDARSDYTRLRSAGITPENFHEALEEYRQLKSYGEREPAWKAKERALVGSKLPGFFPTPKPVISKMLDKADVQPGMSVLEPSAGKGDILDALKSRHPEAKRHAIEISSGLRDLLQAKGHELHDDTDFLEHKGEYDRIIQNPPFENHQDIEHVRHAFSLLKPGGRLVSVMSVGPFQRSMRKDEEFREWFEAAGGEMEPLPAGSFAGKDAFRQTGVATVLVTLDKPG